MKFIRQLDKANKIAKAQQMTYENVSFKNFGTFLQTLVIDKLISEDWARNGTIWDDYRHRDGIILETDKNPMVYQGITLTVSGDKQALDKFRAVMERHADYNGAPQPEDIEVTHQYHDSLHEDLWDAEDDSYHLKPEIREKLLQNAEEFFSFLKMEDMEVEDIVFTGSAANFNWTENSDVDLHIIVDKAKAEKKYGKLVEEYFDAKKRVWNDLHNIIIRGFPVEFYVEGKGEEHHSSGIYSIQDDKWVVEPKHQEPSVDDSAVKAKAAEFIREIQDTLSADRADAVEKMMDKIKKMRQSGLEQAGEFSTNNIVFKILRNGGWLEKLANCKTKAFDRDLSVEDEELSHWVG